MKITGFLLIVLTFCLWEPLTAQPLQFLYEKDSLRVFDVDVEPTSDAGWLIAGIGLDSSIMLMKFDHCGKKEWQKRITQTGNHFAQLHFTISGDVAYVVSSASSALGNRIYFLKYPLNQTNVEEKWINVIGITNMDNPVVAVLPNGKIKIGLQGGNVPEFLDGYIIHLNSDLSISETMQFPGQKVYHMTIGRNNDVYVSLGDARVMQLSDNIIQWVKSIQEHTHLYRNLVFNLQNSEIVVLGREDSGAPGNNFRLSSFDEFGVQDTTRRSDLIEYSPDFKTKLITDKTGYWVLHGAVSDTNRVVAYSSIDAQMRFNFSQRYVMPSSKDSVQSAGICYLEKEKNFAACAANVDSLSFFYAKGNNLLSFSCKNEELNMNATLNKKIKSDTFILTQNKVQAILLSDPVESVDLNIEFTDKRCFKFDFKDGAVPYPPACKGDTILFSAGSDNPFVMVMWSDGRVGNTVPVRVPAELSVTITYCGMTVTQSHKVEELNLGGEITYPDTCKGLKVVFTAGPVSSNLSYKWSNGSTANTITVEAPNTSTVTVTCGETVGVQTHTIKGKSCIDFPNVFIPGSTEDINKIYNPVIANPNIVTRFNMKIYNRWGQLVFESNNYANGWDGNFKGKLAPAETYLVAALVSFGLTEEKIKASFTLIR